MVELLALQEVDQQEADKMTTWRKRLLVESRDVGRFAGGV